ncbi:MAG: glycosyltransferase family 2 protein [Bacteroidia bacterium]|nr:glycosyltransferase family 2 protein [Bacteroidia bacterium]MDW8302293.1 glycosyltransferase family 2 protein [Bacteroidia bacterium]
MPSLSIFFPFYNDAGTVEMMITDAYRYGSQLTNDLEVIAVNDGSKDHTLLELQRMQKKFPELIVINHEQNKGYGGALQSGIKATTKEWIFYTDGDAQYHLDELYLLWKHIPQYDFVNGYKIRRSDGFVRTYIGLAYRKLTKMVFKIPIKDVDCDFRLMRGDLLRSINFEFTSGAITVELVKKMSFLTNKIKEVPVHHYDRIYGKSSFFNFDKITETLKDEIKLIKALKKVKKKNYELERTKEVGAKFDAVQ